MKKVPKHAPSRMESTLNHTLSPMDGPINPVTSAGSTKLTVDKKGPWCQTLPWRAECER